MISYTLLAHLVHAVRLSLHAFQVCLARCQLLFKLVLLLPGLQVFRFQLLNIFLQLLC